MKIIRWSLIQNFDKTPLFRKREPLLIQREIKRWREEIGKERKSERGKRERK
jgi:hypothetical protein